MPRKNKPRSIDSEAALARRIESERTAADMTYEALSSRMESVGCPIDASALYRIEKGKPRRRITVDELVAFSRVFGVPVGRLLLPPELAAKKAAGDLWDAREAVLKQIREANDKLDEIESRLLDLVDAEESEAVLEALRGKAGGVGEDLAHMRLVRGHRDSGEGE